MTISTLPKTRKNRDHPAEDIPGVTRPMTYEEYLESPPEMTRLDIVDGWKEYRRYGEKQLTSPTRDHQDIQGNLYTSFRAYALATKQAKAIQAPCDVRITTRPLRKRQPDVLLISRARLAQNPPSNNPAPLSPAPELVVEIVSPSDRPSVLAAKIADYRAVDVQEVWIVRDGPQTVELLRLAVEEIESVGTYKLGEFVTSFSFSGLIMAVKDIFFEE
jgi:Uma2 family endonuclease